MTDETPQAPQPNEADTPPLPLGSAPEVCAEISHRALHYAGHRPRHLRTQDEQRVLWSVNHILARMAHADRDAPESDANPAVPPEGGGTERLRRALDAAMRLATDEALLREVEAHVAEFRRLRDLDDILPSSRRAEGGGAP